jgi:CBS-domain-containing membrane protein
MRALQTTPIQRAGAGRSPEMKTVADVMVREVTPISPDTAIHEATRLLREEGLPGLPVVDSKGCMVGVLSEHDLIARLAPRRRRPWWHLFVETEQLAREYRKATGMTVGDVMTCSPTSVSPETSLEAVVCLFDAAEVDLVPVVSAGRLVGTVGRRDLAEGLSTRPAAPGRRADAALVADMQERMERETWIPRLRPTVEARDGVLTLWGVVGSDAEKAALITMARAVPGCRAIGDHLLALGARYRYHEMV